MMQAIKQSRLFSSGCAPDKWYIIAQIAPEGNVAWAFDRWRLYYPDECTKVGIFYEAGTFQTENSKLYKTETPDLVAPFNSVNSFEHDFTFDLSSDTANAYLAISNIPSTAQFQQIYCYPTGYSATRNKDANIVTWDFSVVNVAANVGGANSSIFFNHQPLIAIEWRDNTTTPVLYAKTIRFDNCNLNPTELDKVLIWTAAGGITNGTLNYSNNTQGSTVYVPTNASRAAYDLLISRGWTITGTPPPTA